MEAIECLYCGTQHRPAETTNTRSIKLQFPVLSAEWSRSNVAPSEIDCPVCRQKYTYLPKVDPCYLKQHVRFAESALKYLKAMSGNTETLETMLEGNRGAAVPSKRLQVLRVRELDIGVTVGGRRAYLRCRKSKGQILLVAWIGGGRG